MNSIIVLIKKLIWEAGESVTHSYSTDKNLYREEHSLHRGSVSLVNKCTWVVTKNKLNTSDK
jgi:hypothetical protein